MTIGGVNVVFKVPSPGACREDEGCLGSGGTGGTGDRDLWTSAAVVAFEIVDITLVLAFDPREITFVPPPPRNSPSNSISRYEGLRGTCPTT